MEGLWNVFSSIWQFLLGVIISYIISYIFFIKSYKDKQPRYSINSNNLITNFERKVDKLQIFYDDQEIKNLTISNVLFWNAGRETINRDDIVQSEPIRIHLKDSKEILDKNIAAITDSTNQFNVSLSKDRKNLILDFEYLDKNDGAAIQIFHTGNSSDDIEILGKIKGSTIKPNSSKKNDFIKFISVGLPTIAFLILELTAVDNWPHRIRDTYPGALGFIIFIGLVIAAGVLAIGWLFILVILVEKYTGIPNSLRAFYGDTSK